MEIWSRESGASCSSFSGHERPRLLMTHPAAAADAAPSCSGLPPPVRSTAGAREKEGGGAHANRVLKKERKEGGRE
jgi:hypothetical protein